MDTNTTHKTADRSAVQQYAEALMNANGTTTTLDVKNAMRADGYWCDQSEISKHMYDLSGELGWSAQSNGTYNTYSVQQKAASQPTTNGSPTADMLYRLFGIHPSAVDADSRLGTDLGLTELQMAELSLECERAHGKSIPDVLLDEDELLSRIDEFIMSGKAGRARVNIDPIIDEPSGLTDERIGELLSDGVVSDDDWVLSIGMPSSRVIYRGDSSRDHVRTAFARLKGVRIQETRARKVSNIKK